MLPNEQAIVLAEELDHRQNKTPEEDTLLEVLITLIEDFEDKDYQLNKSTSRSIMLH